MQKYLNELIKPRNEGTKDRIQSRKEYRTRMNLSPIRSNLQEVEGVKADKRVITPMSNFTMAQAKDTIEQLANQR